MFLFYLLLVNNVIFKAATAQNIYFQDSFQVHIGWTPYFSPYHCRPFIHYKLIYSSLRNCCQLEMTSSLLGSFKPFKSKWYSENMCYGASKVQTQASDPSPSCHMLCYPNNTKAYRLRIINYSFTKNTIFYVSLYRPLQKPNWLSQVHSSPL